MKLDESWGIGDNKYQCPYCDEIYTKFGICGHIWKKHTEEGQRFNPINNIGDKAWREGRKHSEETRELLSQVNKSNPNCTGRAGTPELEEIRRKRISESGKGKLGGYRKGSGRGKAGWYKGYWCDSSWELAFVIYNLEHNIPFKRNTKRFYYEYQGESHYYVPDFVMEDGTYIEIKGYETDKNKPKYEQFPSKLVILHYEEMSPYLTHVSSKYGKDFIKLYEHR